MRFCNVMFLKWFLKSTIISGNDAVGALKPCIATRAEINHSQHPPLKDLGIVRTNLATILVKQPLCSQALRSAGVFQSGPWRDLLERLEKRSFQSRIGSNFFFFSLKFKGSNFEYKMASVKLTFSSKTKWPAFRTTKVST